MGKFSFQAYADYRPSDFKIERMTDAVGAAEKRSVEFEGRSFGRRMLAPLRATRISRTMIAA